MTKNIFLFFLLFLVSCSLVSAQGENLTLKIAVIGPGDELYLWWGHIALIIEDSHTGRNYVYDYGQFSFEQDNFFYNFAFGRLYYNCGATNAEHFLLLNASQNRDIAVYTLDLPAYKKLEIKKFAENNVLPDDHPEKKLDKIIFANNNFLTQERIYEYHHFNDNCSTRIRDIIDFAVDGQFSEKYKNETGRYTLRQHVRRHTWFSPFADWILNFWMGQGIDTPITVWNEMFLPSEVGKWIEDFYYTDSNGINHKLVKSVDIYFRAKNRPAVLDVPRKQWPYELVFSLVLSLIFGFFFLLAAKNKRAGFVLAGISMSICALVFGTAGVLLYFMSLFTNHDYTFNNMNMIFCSPVLLTAVPLGLCYALAKNRDKLVKYDLYLRLIWLLSAAGILISMLLKLFPQFYQQNLTDQMLMLPITLVFAFHPAGFKDAFKAIRQKLKKNTH